MLSNGGQAVTNNNANRIKLKKEIEAGIGREISIGIDAPLKAGFTSMNEIMSKIKGNSIEDIAYPVIDFYKTRVTPIRQKLIANLAADPNKQDVYNSSYKNYSSNGDDAIMSRWIQQCYTDYSNRSDDNCIINTIAPPSKNVGGKNPATDTPDTNALNEYRKWLLSVYKHPTGQEYVLSLTDGQLRGLLTNCNQDLKCIELKTGLTEAHKIAGDTAGNSNNNYADNGSTVIPGSPNVVIVKHKRDAWN